MLTGPFITTWQLTKKVTSNFTQTVGQMAKLLMRFVCLMSRGEAAGEWTRGRWRHGRRNERWHRRTGGVRGHTCGEQRWGGQEEESADQTDTSTRPRIQDWPRHQTRLPNKHTEMKSQRGRKHTHVHTHWGHFWSGSRFTPSSMRSCLRFQ